MKKNTYAEMGNEELITKTNFMKSILIAFVIIYFIAILILLYLYLNKNYGDASIALLVPIFITPVMLAPVLINYRMLRAEKKSRNL